MIESSVNEIDGFNILSSNDNFINLISTLFVPI